MGASAGKSVGPKYARALELPSKDPSGRKELATFAAGCFWGVELQFQRIPGVLSTAVGYTGGHKTDPTYKEVCSGSTGHTEAVQLEFDPETVTYDDLLDVFWERHDSTTKDRQGNDVGTQYRSAIFYHSEDQKDAALASKEKHQATLDRPIVTEIVEAAKFWMAEEYHQQYLEKGGQCAFTGDKTPIRCYG